MLHNSNCTKPYGSNNANARVRGINDVSRSGEHVVLQRYGSDPINGFRI